MASLEKDLGLDDFQSDSSYFDYVERKTLPSAQSRGKVVDKKDVKPKGANITEQAKYWKEYASS